MVSLKSSIFLLLAILLTQPTNAQGDSTRLLSQEAFLAIVRAYHPVVRSAALQVERAEAGIQQARGAFDPTIDAGFSSKTLDGKAYYQYINPQLTIPTWYGLELIGGVEDVQGERVNPEATTGALSYAGAKLNLSGILLDNRRAVLQQAKSLARQSVAERRLAVNNLIYEAMGAYYNWQREWKVMSIIREALNNAQERYRFVQIEWNGGARPAIDTIEALAQLQAIELQQSSTELAYNNATLELSNYLWRVSGDAMPLLIEMRPLDTLLSLPVPSLEATLERVVSHPKLATLSSKREVLDLERRLKRSYLLPKISVKATMLSKGYSAPSEASVAYLENNSKVAAEIRMPLFLREARGAYRSSQLKLQEINLEIDATSLAIENKVRAAYNEVAAYANQLRIATASLSNYQRLYAGERLRFETGESTLFLLNSRQNKVIEGAQKVAELAAKVQKAQAGLYYAGGILE